jgi:hypothetical protein
MLYIAKDIHETLDYAFVRDVPESIIFVEHIQPTDATLVVESCEVNTQTIFDTEGRRFEAGRVIVLWVSGGALNKSEKLRLRYVTEGGRILDEDVVFRFVEAA